MNFVVSTQHCAMAILLVRPSLTQCTNFRVCSQFWCICGASFVSIGPRSFVHLLFFNQSLHCKVEKPYVPLIWSLHVLSPVPGPCSARVNVSVISSLPGMPRVQCAVSSLGTGLLFLAEPHSIARCHVCSIALISRARVFSFLQRLTVRMLGSALTLSTVRCFIFWCHLWPVFVGVNHLLIIPHLLRI